MADIVETLRTGKEWLNDGDCCGDVDNLGICCAPACIFGEALEHFFLAAEEITRLRAENEKIRAAFRVNMLRAFPNLSHEEIDAEINRVLETKDEIQS